MWRNWKIILVLVPSEFGEPRAQAWTDAVVAFGLAVAAAVLIKLPALFGLDLEEHAGVFANVYPFTPRGHIEVLSVLHLP